MIDRRDVFIAHAHQDKDEFVRPLVTALGRRAVTCWVDEAQIRPGDSLVGAMNEGLASADYVVAVITTRFLAAPWAPRELAAALQLEARQRETKVVPVVAVSPELLVDYPLLLDKRWLDWSQGIDSVADDIARLLDRQPARDWYVDPPESYVGEAWMRAVATRENEGCAHRFTLRWAHGSDMSNSTRSDQTRAACSFTSGSQTASSLCRGEPADCVDVWFRPTA